ncbi:hypothetical protein CCP3SC5AM1_730013 [Gammaproteobacteria bacterium]
MTNSQPRASRPSAIRRRPQPTQSVDEFIQAGTNSDGPVTEKSPASPAHSPLESPHVVRTVHETPVSPHSAGDGKTYFALFLGVCALGVGLFNLYHSWEPLVHETQRVVHLEAPPVHSEVGTLSAPPITNNENSTTAQAPMVIQGVQWLAITDLQFARHDLLLGLNTSARDSLILAKVHLGLLGEPFAAETTALDRIISRLKSTPVLSLGQLDHDIETLKETWLQVIFSSAKGKGLLGWLSSSHSSLQEEGREELETTDAGRHLTARLDRLKWLALWGDESGFRQASITLETFLGPQFLDSSEAKSWLLWLRGLQRIPLRHDVTELNALIVRLSRLELPP